jgi:hypothetical protein
MQKWQIILTVWHQNSIPIAIIMTPDLNYIRFDFSCKLSQKKRKEIERIRKNPNMAIQERP